MGEHGRGWGERRGAVGGRPPSLRQTPPQAKPQPPPPQTPLKATKVLLRVRVGERRRGNPPWQKAQTPRTHPHRMAYEGRRRPQTHQPPQDSHRQPPPTQTKTGTPKVGGATAKKEDDSPDDLIVRPVAHVPLPTGLEKGTVRGVHGRKGGALLVEYPGGTTLYEVARHLLFPIAEEAERYREEARSGKKKSKPPAPTNEETNLPNPNPTSEPANPANPPSGATKTWDPITGVP